MTRNVSAWEARELSNTLNRAIKRVYATVQSERLLGYEASASAYEELALELDDSLEYCRTSDWHRVSDGSLVMHENSAEEEE